MNEKEEEVEEEFAEEDEEEVIDLDKEDQAVKTTMLIPRKTLKQIGHIAVEQGESKAEVIRKALNEYIEAHNPKVKEDKEYAEKIKKLIETKKKVQEKGYEVRLYDEDFLPENIDKAIATLEKAIKEED